MKILIVGSTGMLGNTLKQYFLAIKYEIKTLDRKDLDLSQCSWGELEDKIIESDCDILINCAGLIKQRKGVTTADFIAVNSLLPHRMADICEQQNMKMIHITTDCVFSGGFGNYNEDSVHDVTDDYGRSKSMGEPENCTVIRTSIIGEEENNKLSLLEWVKSNKDTKIKGYTNHQWNGVTCLQLSKTIRQIIDENLYWKGVRHIYTDDSVNKCQLVKMINEIYQLNSEIEGQETDISVNRTLKSNFDTKIFKIPFLYKQVEEMRKFHINLKNKELEDYYTNLL